ncbi:MAG: hypothetical protein ABIH41_06185 [Nanoarchaeota archaeon]
MNLKQTTGAVLAIGLFLIGNIILLGFVQGSLAGIAHFAFVIILLGVFLISMKGLLSSPKTMAAGITIILLIAFSTAHLASAVRTYQDEAGKLTASTGDLQAQITALENSNAEYSDYITYLTKEITATQTRSLQLQAKIDQVEQENARRAAEQAQEIPTPIITPPVEQPIITQERPRSEDHEEEEEEDDD